MYAECTELPHEKTLEPALLEYMPTGHEMKMRIHVFRQQPEHHRVRIAHVIGCKHDAVASRQRGAQFLGAAHFVSHDAPRPLQVTG